MRIFDEDLTIPAPTIILEKMLEELKRVPYGQEFCVSDLFIGWQFARLPQKTKNRVGVLFRATIEGPAGENVEILAKKRNNSQLYVKRHKEDAIDNENFIT